jgi:nitroreductase
MTDIPAGSSDEPLSVPAAIRRRRSQRHYKPDPIPAELLDELIQLTVAAPSSWNLQPWRIVIVTDAEQRERLSQACFKQPQPIEAPVSFVFAISHSGWRTVFDEVVQTAQDRGAWDEGFAGMMRKVAPGFQEAMGERLREYNTKDALIAATHLALAAESLGLGTSFMNGYVEDQVKEVIGAADDDDIGISLVMSVGYPSESRDGPGRLPLERNVFHGTMASPWSD